MPPKGILVFPSEQLQKWLMQAENLPVETQRSAVGSDDGQPGSGAQTFCQIALAGPDSQETEAFGRNRIDKHSQMR